MLDHNTPNLNIFQQDLSNPLSDSWAVFWEMLSVMLSTEAANLPILNQFSEITLYL